MLRSDGRVRLVLAAVFAALLTAAVLAPAAADSGDPLTMGEFNTAERDRTTLWANANQFALRIRQARPGAPALSLETDGAPPLTVDSAMKVENLNADQVDGRDLAQIRPAAAWCSNDDIQPGENWNCAVDVEVPAGGGTLVMAGSYDVLNTGGAPDGAGCYFLLDGAELTDSRHRVSVISNGWGVCATNAARGVPEGTYTVRFRSFGLATPTMDADDGTFHVVVIPG